MAPLFKTIKISAYISFYYTENVLEYQYILKQRIKVNLWYSFQSSRSAVFCGKVIWKLSENLQENTCSEVPFLYKVVGLQQIAALLK